MFLKFIVDLISHQMHLTLKVKETYIGSSLFQCSRLNSNNPKDNGALRLTRNI
jgi:hypothetical protein